MSVDLIKEAAVELSNGNFVTVWKGGLREAESKVGRYTPLLNEYVTENKTPSWMESTTDVTSYRLSAHQYGALMDNNTLSIDCPSDIDAVEIPVANPTNCEHIKITSDCGEIKNEVSIDSSYNYNERLWKTVSLPERSRSVELIIEIETSSSRLMQMGQLTSRLLGASDEVANPKVGVPAIAPSQEQPPVIIVSIDTLRYDSQDSLKPLLDELGSDAYIPKEPRTQGTWTVPSHASMFTGTHPGTHGLVGWGDGKGDKRPINPELSIIPEILTDVGYKCSGMVHHSRITPEFGFGDGFHRLYENSMTWENFIDRSTDAQTSVNRLIKWINKDTRVRDHSLFYFLHVFDPHLPYVPPIEYIDTADIDLSKPAEFRSVINKQADTNYPERYEPGTHTGDDEIITEMQSWYAQAITYTAEQLARLVQHLKQKSLFEESLLIITGDHGEEFGEQRFFGHGSVNEGNIRPFMAVKPPASAGWDVRDNVDTIDFFPTVAKLVGVEDVSCDGVPLQEGETDNTRITELIKPNWYTVSVEVGGCKGILVYQSNYPDRPTEAMLNEGPTKEIYRRLSSVRGSANTPTISSQKKSKIRSLCEEFVETTDGEYSADSSVSRPSQETMDQLNNLGYK